MNKEWFASWFDSPFYHLLYQNRNDEEAKAFVDHLIEYLAPRQGARMLDIACGKGRFSIYLSEKGYEVVGMDLAPSNIKAAREFENDRLSFYTHDMRDPFRFNHFDYAFNFFTSFGYFDNEEDHLKTLESIYKGLKPGGIFLIDFINSHKAIDQLIEKEQRKVGQTYFHIERKEENGYLHKLISLEHNHKKMQFEERVRAFTKEDFEEMFASCGFNIQAIFGNYQLEAYEADISDRLIIIGKK